MARAGNRSDGSATSVQRHGFERPLVSPPQKPLPFVLREGATTLEMATELAEKLPGYRRNGETPGRFRRYLHASTCVRTTSWHPRRSTD
jgi:hypothetical protein